MSLEICCYRAEWLWESRSFISYQIREYRIGMFPRTSAGEASGINFIRHEAVSTDIHFDYEGEREVQLVAIALFSEAWIDSIIRISSCTRNRSVRTEFNLNEAARSLSFLVYFTLRFSLSFNDFCFCWANSEMRGRSETRTESLFAGKSDHGEWMQSGGNFNPELAHNCDAINPILMERF